MPSPGSDPVTKAEVTGQAVVFRTTARSGVVVTKTFRLLPEHRRSRGRSQVRESRQGAVCSSTTCSGPHGIPIEGEWYTGTFRDVVFGQLERAEDRRS